MAKWIRRSIVLCGILVGGASLQAHDSLAGVYVAWQRVKSHRGVQSVQDRESPLVDADGVKNQGRLRHGVELVGGSVGQISRLGLKDKDGPNALLPGDEIIVTIVPAADGKSPVGLL